jgi:hypothetical protein
MISWGIMTLVLAGSTYATIARRGPMKFNQEPPMKRTRQTRFFSRTAFYTAMAYTGLTMFVILSGCSSTDSRERTKDGSAVSPTKQPTTTQPAPQVNRVEAVPTKPPAGQLITKAYFYDLQTGMLFVGDNSAIPPIPAPSGKKSSDGQDLGVRAIVFSCGNCKDESSRYIGYVETFTPEARDAIKAMMEHPDKSPPDGRDPMMFGRYIMDPEVGDWLTMDSPAAGKLVQDSMSKCGADKYPTQCFPDK